MSDLADHAPTADELTSHAHIVRALARAILGDHHAAEDLAQDAYVVALENPPGRPDRLGGWLAGITRNLARMRRRSVARRQVREGRVVPGPAPTPPDRMAERLEMQEQLVAAVRALEEPYRSMIVLRFFDGLTPGEIAARLEVPIGTVHTRIRRALEILRARLDRDRHHWRAGLLILLGSNPSLTTGALLMSAKTKLVAAAAVVMLAAGAAVISLAPQQAPAPEPDRVASVPPALPDDVAVAPEAPAEPVTDTAPADEQWKLHVEVYTSRGEPASMALVTFVSTSGERRGGTNADAFGKATIAAEGAGRLLVMGVDDHAPHQVPDLAPPESGEQTLRVDLRTGLEIAGRLVDQHGVGIAGARVKGEFEEMPSWLVAGFVFINAQTDDQGRFRITGLLPGSYRLTPRVKHSQPGTPPDPPVMAKAGDNDVEIRLRPPSSREASVILLLIDSETGEPIMARVEVRVVDENGERSVVSGRGQGRFAVPIRGSMRMRLRVLAEGYAPADSEELVLTAGESGREITVKLTPDPDSLVPFTLVLMDDLGAPVEEVQLSRKSPVGDSWAGTVEKAPGGRLALPLPAGTHHFRISTPSFSRMRPEFGIVLMQIELAIEPGGITERTVVLTRAGAVRFRYPPEVVDLPGGGTLERTGVFLETTDGEYLRARTSGKYLAGERVYIGIPPGQVVAVFKHGDGEKEKRTIEVRPGETTEVVFTE